MRSTICTDPGPAARRGEGGCPPPLPPGRSFTPEDICTGRGGPMMGDDRDAPDLSVLRSNATGGSSPTGADAVGLLRPDRRDVRDAVGRLTRCGTITCTIATIRSARPATSGFTTPAGHVARGDAGYREPCGARRAVGGGGEGVRLEGRGLVDRDHPVRFSFDGRDFHGFRGDSLASALLAAGVRVVGRSFKYHRPRGVVTAGQCRAQRAGDARGGCRAAAELPRHHGGGLRGADRASQNGSRR